MPGQLFLSTILGFAIVLSVGLLRAEAKPNTNSQLIGTALSQPEPSKLYYKVWQLIRDDFYDPTYNHQKWSRWEHRYDDKMKTMDDAYKAIDTMLVSLGDRYTRFLNPQAFEDEQTQIEAHLFGVGVQIGLDKLQRIVVIAPIEGSPASIAGLMTGDEIIEIGGKSARGLSVEDASKQIRGPAGTEVELTILRDKETKKFKITRAQIQMKSVQTVQMLNSDVGYIRLSTFISQAANQEMRVALDRLSPARGIIIDLRDNPGGLLSNAVDICSMFLDGGVIVSTVDRVGHKIPTSANGHPLSHQPLVILINGGSASASEITSGCLHDSNRAQLVGQKSFGKGLVQGINKLPDGAGINITVARYLTPNNTDINKKGIQPDYLVDLKMDDYHAGRGPWWIDLNGLLSKRNPSDMKDLQLKKAVEVVEQKIQASTVDTSPYEVKLNPYPEFGDPGNGLHGHTGLY